MITTGKNAKGIHKNARDIQVLMHNLEIEQFLETLILASYNASDDTSDFESKVISENWNKLALLLENIVDEENLK